MPYESKEDTEYMTEEEALRVLNPTDYSENHQGEIEVEPQYRNTYDIEAYQESSTKDNEQDKAMVPIEPSEIINPDVMSKEELRAFLDDKKSRNKSIEKGEEIYNGQIVSYNANNQAKVNIAYSEQNKLYIIEYEGEILLDEINKNGEICLWKYKNKFYYRSAQGNEIHKGNKKEISAIIESFRRKPIKIVSKDDILKNNLIVPNMHEKYILTYQIKAIENEIFEPKEEDFFEKDGVLYKNLFSYTKYLKKRFEHTEGIKLYDCFIIEFFENIANEVNQNESKLLAELKKLRWSSMLKKLTLQDFQYQYSEFCKETSNKLITSTIMNWLSYFFQKMESSNIALVLHGSKEIAEDIFWKKLIKPIFGNEEHCIAINDSILKKPISEIVKNKIFFHIGDFSPTEDNKNKINQLLQGILVDKYVLTDSNPPIRIPVNGQILITTNETISYMSKYYSLFEYINIQNEREIISNLADDILDLSFKMTDDLDTFSTLLAAFRRNYNQNNRLSVVSKMNKVNTDESLESFEDKIQKFIKAIKDINMEYFEIIKDKDNEAYKELEFSFNKQCFIGQDLLNYFNIKYNQQTFKSNKQFLITLKEKDKMFRQELTKLKALNENGEEEVLFNGNPTYKEVENKKLYKINDYTLPENIKIPRNWIIVNREGNQRFKYKHEAIDHAKIIHKDYDKKNKK